MYIKRWPEYFLLAWVKLVQLGHPFYLHTIIFPRSLVQHIFHELANTHSVKMWWSSVVSRLLVKAAWLAYLNQDARPKYITQPTRAAAKTDKRPLFSLVQSIFSQAKKRVEYFNLSNILTYHQNRMLRKFDNFRIKISVISNNTTLVSYFTLTRFSTHWHFLESSYEISQEISGDMTINIGRHDHEFRATWLWFRET